MAKQPTTIDRFRIYAETSADNMGHLLAQLTRMGLENIGYELVTDVKAYGRKRNGDASAIDAMREYVKDHPTFAIAAAISHFEPQGRTSSSIYSAAGQLVKDGVLKKLSPGNYSATDVKAIAGPKAEPENNMAFLLRYIKGRKRFTTKELLALFRADDRKTDAISGRIHDLVNRKLIKRVGQGEYEVLRPKKKAKSPAKKKASPLNGAQAAATETAHG